MRLKDRKMKLKLFVAAAVVLSSAVFGLAQAVQEGTGWQKMTITRSSAKAAEQLLWTKMFITLL